MFEEVDLDDQCSIYVGKIPSRIIPDDELFEKLWNLHPVEYSEILLHGKKVKVPRWDRAYEKDYPFSNQVAASEPAPLEMAAFLDWATNNVDDRINGLFVNWHDGSLNHYHGRHRDSVQGLIVETPIVTVSLGEQRILRMRPYQKLKPVFDFELNHGDFIVIPWHTNQHWTHEIPKFKRYQNRRISVTMRAFE